MTAWHERKVDEALVEALVEAGESRLMARLLAGRGVTPATREAYFSPDLKGLSGPEALPGVKAAVEALLAAVRENRLIVIFGDYDCDGVCATTILVRTLRAVGARVAPFIPDRQTEGYGMSEKSVARLLSEHPDVGLVVTVDNGINSVDEVSALTARGIAVVVTDHHLPGPDLPACPIVNPKVASPESLEGLCGAGVAFFVAGAFINRAKAEGLYTGGSLSAPFLVLAGLATVTDVMPLKDQNRILVVSALKLFRRHAPVGLKELLAKASRTTALTLSTHDFSFLLGPRINAAGRVASAMDALKLELSDDREEARELARKVDFANVARKNIEKAMTAAALSKIVPGASAQVIDLPEGHPGVSGIVAQRVLDHLAASTGAVPVCVVVDGHGSARAPDGWNVRDAFEASEQWLTRYGGHAAAGGFSVKEGALDAFRDAFAAACAAQVKDAAQGGLTIDAWVDASDLTLELAKSVGRMAPFGEANTEPLFAVRGVRFASVQPLGSDGSHLQCAFQGSRLRAVWFGQGGRVESLRAASARPHDICFTLTVSTYGEPHVELRLADVKESLT